MKGNIDGFEWFPRPWGDVARSYNTKDDCACFVCCRSHTLDNKCRKKTKKLQTSFCDLIVPLSCAALAAHAPFAFEFYSLLLSSSCCCSCNGVAFLSISSSEFCFIRGEKETWVGIRPEGMKVWARSTNWNGLILVLLKLVGWEIELLDQNLY